MPCPLQPSYHNNIPHAVHAMPMCSLFVIAEALMLQHTPCLGPHAATHAMPVCSLFVIVVALMLSLMNYRGLTVVGNSMVASAIAIVVPFVLLVVLSVPHIKPVNWLEYKEEEVDWGTFINVMFWWASCMLCRHFLHRSIAYSRLGGQLAKNTWTAHPSLVLFVRRNLNYWDCVSTLAGEVRNPGKNFPRALLMAVILVVAMYLLPTMAALGVSSSADPAAGWGMGYYCQVAEKVGGLNGKLCSYFSS
eukprot:1160324-Pelagomonas_calceolata.AAC.4